ncbi:SHOCT domain-containing protein [Natronorubrum tibetense]|uniref:SHOCT domain-containing protein n=1 Tax=Natronorubrum tibetense GA33 TaxID=1114856 RepID=L9VP96_9EURY|nr:SHOCT domain-containing protein [Natronorubrum tibetense]ELY38979.1 hypothetical protein C496_16347 [Natronorubrum tibetense GA33]
MPFDEQTGRRGDASATDNEGSRPAADGGSESATDKGSESAAEEMDGLEIKGPERRRLRERLDSDERVQYALRGRIMDYETNDDDRDRREESRTRKMASRGRDLLTLVTDRRLLVVIQREAPADHEYRSISYDELRGAKLETANGNQRLVLRGPKRYYIDVGRTSTDDTTAACSTIRQQIETESDDDSFDSLERLEALFEQGHLTEREFETMKRELLE